jgi:hypothetical protein
MTTVPRVNERLQRARLMLRALDGSTLEGADRWREERASLWALAQDALPRVVGRVVEMPFLHGLDVGARLVYERPAPYEHILEYVAAGAQGYSYDDPRGWYEAEDGARGDRRVALYLATVREFCQRWGLTEPWAERMIVYGHTHAIAEGQDDAGTAALDALIAPGGDATAVAEQIVRVLSRA